MLHKYLNELDAAKDEMHAHLLPEHGDVIIKLKFDGVDILGAGWRFNKDSSTSKVYFEISTPLIEMIAKIQENLIEQGFDPLRTLLFTLQPDGKFTVDATYEDPKTP